ncbi:TonB-dependent receptor [Croceicoccus sediminis]|uniref:TonB-dependent receptor n=1 Tax=Croceicoccus sediminis TaxID=2571150 RepID=UPI001F0F47D0|nr:TonB-dependent receptor [Croceicoccus sediminis]
MERQTTSRMAIVAATIASLATSPVRAEEIDQREAEAAVIAGQDYESVIFVYGRSEKRIGVAAAASEGGVAGADIEVRPLLRPGELLEATPGLIATQHSGGGKANQFFLRGFNLDHGTDFSLYLDDMPVNFRTHGHGQGYLDVNGLIPEAVARVDYRKGPYRADRGDFSFVGSSSITTHDTLAPFAVVEAGGYGYRRAVAGGSASVGEGDLLLLGQAKFNDGPWELPEDFEGYSAFAKYSAPLGTGEFRASFNLFHASWAPTEQLPERVVGTDLCEDRYCSLDPTLRGTTKREVLTVNYADEDWRFTVWAQHYDWSLLSNFTYFLEDPVKGDQLRQFEERWSYGGRAERSVDVSSRLDLTLGTEIRHDSIDPVGLDETVGGELDFNYNAFEVDETSAGLYAEATWRPMDGFIVIGGLRGDWYRFETRPISGVDVWGGVAGDHIVSPKLGLNYEVVSGIALYANWGEGFHSNDARGVTNPANPAPGLVEGTMKEVGARFERGGAILTAVYWWSEIDSELIYVGDSGAVEPSDPGKRRGYELTGFYKPTDWLAVDAVLTGTKARYVGLPKGEDYIPGSLESSGEIGVSAIFPDFNASARLRYLGPHPLIEDNSVRGKDTLLVNVRAAWTPRKIAGLEVYAELLNAFASADDDIDYYYATRFPGEPAGGVEDNNSRIVEPRQFRIGVKKAF